MQQIRKLSCQVNNEERTSQSRAFTHLTTSILTNQQWAQKKGKQ